jgi:phosphoglycolate phosphatase-like HAD superfamily hydrolase
MLPGADEYHRSRFEQFCLEYEFEAVKRMPDLYPQAHELLGSLRAAGKTLVLISNGTPSYIQHVWDHAGYQRYFALSMPFERPAMLSKGQRMALAMTQFGGRPETSIMIGDRSSDREAAAHTGAWFIACRYGYGSENEHDGAHAWADNVEELFELLLAC